MAADIISPEILKAYIAANLSTLTATQIDALNRINLYKYNSLIQNNLNNPILFFFEGAGGASADPTVSLYNPARYNGSTEIGYDPAGYRYSAMVAVIKKDVNTGNNVIAALFKDASTLPDQPKGNACNNGRDVPTLLSGVYKMVFTKHGSGKYSYPALNIITTTNNVVRYGPVDPAGNLTGWYVSTSYGIDIHEGSWPAADGVQYFSIHPNDTWSISSGCHVINGTDYLSFSQIVGFDKNGNGRIDREDKISGCAIIDRKSMDVTREDLVNLYGNDGLALIV